MMSVKVNNQNELVNVLSMLDCEEFIMIEIDNEKGYFIMDLYYDSTTDKFSMFDKCDIEFESLDDMERHLIREYL
mgnify:CR=1 FL=1